MSALRIANYRNRSVADAAVRALVMERDLETFCSDLGRAPYTLDEAKVVPVRWWLGELPAVGLEYLKPLDEDAPWNATDLSDDWDSVYDERDFDSRTSVYWAFWEAEAEVSQQKEDMWVRQECGGFAAEDLPVFVRRATLEEDVLDMAFRQLLAERRQDDLQAGLSINWCV